MKSMPRARALALTMFVSTFLLLFGLLAWGRTDGSLKVAYIDVGQGDSILLHASDGTDILIDGGPPLAGPTVVAYLQNEGIDDIEVMVVTHADAEHVGGLIDVLSSTISVESVLYPSICQIPAFCPDPTYQELVTGMQNRGLTPTPAYAHQTHTWGSINSFVVNPIIMPTEQVDENSVVMLIVYGDVRFLFAADISSHTERFILNDDTLASWSEADVLKVARHGSGDASGAQFLETVGAEVAIVSVGADNAYGYPAQETLDRLRAAGARVFRTDQRGTIVVTTNGHTFQVDADWVVFLPAMMRQGLPAATPTPKDILANFRHQPQRK